MATHFVLDSVTSDIDNDNRHVLGEASGQAQSLPETISVTTGTLCVTNRDVIM